MHIQFIIWHKFVYVAMHCMCIATNLCQIINCMIQFIIWHRFVYVAMHIQFIIWHKFVCCVIVMEFREFKRG